jgi:peptide/nickel transport system permease protein
VAESDLIVVEPPAPPDPEFESDLIPPLDLAPGRKGTLVGIALVIAGLVAMVVSMAVLVDANSFVRLLVAAVGFTLSYLGLRALGRRVFGSRFDLALWLCIVWLLLVTLAAIFADVLPLAESKDVSKTLTEPTLLRPDLFSEHPLGTDRQGLDILGGVIYGARVSLVVGLGAVLIGIVLGGSVGIAAGYSRGRLESGVNLLSDSMLAFPPLILLLGMVAVLGPSVRNVTVALALLGIPTYIRLSRANTLVFSQREFVLAARALGDRSRSIMFRELLPNVLLPIVTFGFLVVAVLIVAESSLSFLGLSVQRPNPTWGNMIAAGQENFDEHPHVVFIPGMVLFLTVFAFNRLGDRARERWDPRQTKI